MGLPSTGRNDVGRRLKADRMSRVVLGGLAVGECEHESQHESQMFKETGGCGGCPTGAMSKRETTVSACATRAIARDRGRQSSSQQPPHTVCTYASGCRCRDQSAQEAEAVLDSSARRLHTVSRRTVSYVHVRWENVASEEVDRRRARRTPDSDGRGEGFREPRDEKGSDGDIDKCGLFLRERGTHGTEHHRSFDRKHSSKRGIRPCN